MVCGIINEASPPGADHAPRSGPGAGEGSAWPCDLVVGRFGLFDHVGQALPRIRPAGTALTKPRASQGEPQRALTQPWVHVPNLSRSPNGTALIPCVSHACRPSPFRLGPPRCGYRVLRSVYPGLHNARSARIAWPWASIGPSLWDSRFSDKLCVSSDPQMDCRRRQAKHQRLRPSTNSIHAPGSGTAATSIRNPCS